MAVGVKRNPLGMMLGNSILPGDQPDYGMGDFPKVPHNYAQTEQPKKAGFLAPGSKGQMIAGIIADALAGATGGQPVFGQMLARQREAAAEEAQWHKRRMAGREDKQWEWDNKPKDDAVPPILRDAQAWASMPEPLRKAYQEMQEAKGGDEFITTTLPNGQFYAGPRRGLPGALTGQTQPSASRNLGPVVDSIPGGPQATPAATFP